MLQFSVSGLAIYVIAIDKDLILSHPVVTATICMAWLCMFQTPRTTATAIV